MSSLSSPQTILLLAGLALIATAIVGGGIEIREIKIPQISLLPRAASFLVGCILMIVALAVQFPGSPPTLAATPPAPAQPAPSAPQASGPPTPAPPTRELQADVQPTALCKIQPGRGARPSPGVDCTGKGTLDEVEICRSTSLCELDWRLFNVYQEKRAPLDKDQQSRLAKDEGAWVKKRGDCKSDTSCITSAYRSRIDELTR